MQCRMILQPCFRTSLCRTRNLLPLLYLLILFSTRDYLLFAFRALFVQPRPGSHESTTQAQRELLQIHVVFKHGHRAPFRIYKTDPNPKELWPEGLGMLTQLGRLQMYLVGWQLRQRYGDFLSYDPNEIYMQSSDAMRSLYSAYSLLAGLYPPDELWTFATDLPWQPIEVHYVPEEKEKYLQSNPNCPKYEASKKQTANSEETQDFQRRHQKYYDFWHKYSGNTVHSYQGSGDLFKTLSVESDSNLTLPEWALKYWDELVHQSDVAYYYNFKTKLQQRLRAGPILGIMLDRMKERMEGKGDSIKVYGYSGHGSNIAAIQCALLSYDMKHAPHAATLVQELYAEQDGTFSTRLLIYNASHPERQMEPPFALRLHACASQFCPVQTYAEFLRDLVPDNWEKECQEQEEFPDDMTPLQQPEYIAAE